MLQLMGMLLKLYARVFTLECHVLGHFYDNMQLVTVECAEKVMQYFKY